MQVERRRLLVTLAALGAAVPRAALGQSYPARTVTVIAPIAPGGAVDTIARILAEKLQERLGQSFVVENRTGAGGLIGTASVAKAAADGYTLLLIESSATLAKWLHKQAPYDVVNDFSPVALVATSALVLFASPALPANDVRQLIDYARANPGKLTAGTPGIGSPHHLAVLMLNLAAAIDIANVSYRGSAAALSDLLAGQIPMIWSTPVAVLPFVVQGKVKPLGVSTSARLSILPQVPTLAENALEGFHLEAWLGIAAPAKVPRDVVDRLSKAIAEITALPDVERRLSPLGFSIDYQDAESFRALIASEHERYGAIIRAAGIVPN